MILCPAALYPIDTIKTRMQMARTGGGVRALFKSGGGKALYAGEPAIGCDDNISHGAWLQAQHLIATGTFCAR
jgi:hypothetical protein